MICIDGRWMGVVVNGESKGRNWKVGKGKTRAEVARFGRRFGLRCALMELGCFGARAGSGIASLFSFADTSLFAPIYFSGGITMYCTKRYTKGLK